MKKIIFLALTIIMLAVVPVTHAQVEGRFGFEYNEIEPWDDPKHDSLLSKLKEVTGPGDITVNALGGGWRVMQPNPEADIDFTTTDQIVQLFGRYGFSLAWNVWPNAEWAFPNKPNCQPSQFPRACAPEPEFEQHWINYIKEIVERYDNDGVDDMPGLQQPVGTYIMTGEVKFAKNGLGDESEGPFWFDTIDNLLRFHQITYQAIKEADPTGNSKVISSGAVLWDLYADFPDYPEFDPLDPNSAIQRRLNGENFKGSTYTAGWDSLKKMLDSFGNDVDGIEADYIGWHPHFSWRIIDQEFQFIRAHAQDKPIYVDDMWSNLFAQGYFVGPLATIPGEAQFNAAPNPFSGTEWVTRLNGDFPNSLFTGVDPYAQLMQGIKNGDQAVLDWYYANGARRLVKSFASALGEGAIVANFSGSNDIDIGRALAPEIGWINLTGTRQEGYFKKPQYYTYKLLVDKLKDFTTATEIAVSNDPRTRVYEFDRPAQGPVYILWSETGEAPPNLDYSMPNGETVTLKVKNNTPELMLTHIITDTMDTEPVVEVVATQNGRLTIQLGYEPIFLEGDFLTDVTSQPQALPSSFKLVQNYPNPFNPSTNIRFDLPLASQVSLIIYNALGQTVRTLLDRRYEAGSHQIIWDGRDDFGKPIASGVYFLRMVANRGQGTNDFVQIRKVLLLQ